MQSSKDSESQSASTSSSLNRASVNASTTFSSPSISNHQPPLPLSLASLVPVQHHAASNLRNQPASTAGVTSKTNQTGLLPSQGRSAIAVEHTQSNPQAALKPESTLSTTKRPVFRRSNRRTVPIVPGFGTRSDLRRLAHELSLGQSTRLSTETVEYLIMARGRGLRGSAEPSEKKPSVINPQLSQAWASFMQEEGVGTGVASRPATNDAESSVGQSQQSTRAKRGRGKDAKTDIDKDNRVDEDGDARKAAATDLDTRVYILPIPETVKAITAAPSRSKKAKSNAGSSGTVGGVLLQAGTLDARVVGRKSLNKQAAECVYSLFTPARLLPKVQIARVFTSCSAAHSVAIDVHQQVYGWGRNESLALGPGLPETVAYPTLLTEVPGQVQAAALGKSHTLWWMTDGSLYGTGANKSGQCGVKSFVDLTGFKKCVLPDGCAIVQVCYSYTAVAGFLLGISSHH
jgi:Regulator of chromosome condensation (RCC1) repeat